MLVIASLIWSLLWVKCNDPTTVYVDVLFARSFSLLYSGVDSNRVEAAF
jgi:hypothetical protein